MAQLRLCCCCRLGLNILLRPAACRWHADEVHMWSAPAVFADFAVVHQLGPLDPADGMGCGAAADATLQAAIKLAASGGDASGWSVKITTTTSVTTCSTAAASAMNAAIESFYKSKGATAAKGTTSCSSAAKVRPRLSAVLLATR